MKFINAILIVALLWNPVLAGHGYVQRNNNVVVRQKVVQFDEFQTLKVVAIPVSDTGLQYYYEAQPLRGSRKLSQEDVDTLVNAIMSEFDKRFEVTDEAGEDEPGEPDSPEGTPDQPTGQPAEATTESKVIALFQERCATCHDGTNPKNKIVLLSNEHNLATLTDRQVSKIVIRTEGGAGLDKSLLMPKGGPALSQEDIDLLKLWQRERFEE